MGDVVVFQDSQILRKFLSLKEFNLESDEIDMFVRQNEKAGISEIDFRKLSSIIKQTNPNQVFQIAKENFEAMYDDYEESKFIKHIFNSSYIFISDNLFEVTGIFESLNTLGIKQNMAPYQFNKFMLELFLLENGDYMQESPLITEKEIRSRKGIILNEDIEILLSVFSNFKIQKQKIEIGIFLNVN